MISLEPIWSWTEVALLAVALVVFVLVTYPPRVRHLKPLLRRGLLGLRLLTVAVIVLAMLRPSITATDDSDEQLVLLVLADASRSMQTKDGPGGITRRDAVLKTLAESDEVLQRIAERVEVRTYDFADGLEPVEELKPDADGNLTRIGTTLKQLLDETNAAENYLAALVLSDGAERTLPGDEDDPRTLAGTLARQRRLPLYGVNYGSDSLTDASRDLIVEDLLVDPLVFEKKAVPVTAKIRVVGAANEQLSVRLLVEDRSGVDVGQTGPLVPAAATGAAVPVKTIRTSRNQDVIPVELSFVPEQPGSYKLALEVVPIDGELRTANNRQETIITVRKGGLTVAYFDTPRAEQKFLRAINGFEKVQLDYYPIRFGGLLKTTIPAELFDPERYDVYIIGDVPADVFGVDNLNRLTGRVDDGAGLLMIGGPHTFGQGGYGKTLLARYVPVRLGAGERNFDDPLQMVPTRRGLTSYVMRLDTPEKNAEQWADLAPLSGANLLTAKNNAVSVLAESADEKIPLLFAHEVGPARVMAFAADTTFQWYLAGSQAEHQRFWQNVILWLAHKEDDGDGNVFVTVSPKNFSPEQPVPIEFGARTDEGEPIIDAEFNIRIVRSTEAGEVSDPQRFQRTGSAERNRLEWKEPRQAGDYTVFVSASRGGESLGPEVSTRFLVDDRDIETDNPAADPTLLADLARASGGAMLTSEEVGAFLTRKLDEFDSLDREYKRPLWDNWIVLLIFVVLLTTEWAIRKKAGLV